MLINYYIIQLLIFLVILQTQNRIMKDSHYDSRVEVAINAFDNGCMIFTLETKKWYTPREFVNSGELVFYNDKIKKVYNNVRLIPAKKALEIRLEDLEKAQDAFKDFVKRLNGAFNLVPVKKE